MGEGKGEEPGTAAEAVAVDIEVEEGVDIEAVRRAGCNRGCTRRRHHTRCHRAAAVAAAAAAAATDILHRIPRPLLLACGPTEQGSRAAPNRAVV